MSSTPKMARTSIPCLNANYLLKKNRLREIILNDDDTAAWVEKLIHTYLDYANVMPGFLLSLARRLITVSLGQESVEKTRERYERIKNRLRLNDKMVNRLSDWIDLPGSDPAVVNLVLLGNRFRLHLRREVVRIFGSDEGFSDYEDSDPITNTVNNTCYITQLQIT